MTLEEKAGIALKHFQRWSMEYGYTAVKYIGRWKHKDVFSDATPRKIEKISIGMPSLCAVSEKGSPELLGVSDIISPDFPPLPDED